MKRESRLRFERGLLAKALLHQKSWTRLGFVRLGDYTRERLGVAARTIEEEVRVARALEGLPQTTAALLDAALSWTHVRILTTVASAGDEERWLALASRSDTRSLEALVREHRRSMPEAPAGEPVAGVRRFGGEAEEGDVSFSVRVTRAGRRLWRSAWELAERSAGSPLGQAQVLELVVAEAASGAAWPETALPEAESALLMERNAAAAGESAVRHVPTPISDTAPGPEALRPASPGPAARVPAPNSAGKASRLPEKPEAEDPRELDRRLRGIRAEMQRIDADLGRLLRLALDTRLHRHFGYPAFEDYVEARFGFCARKAWALVAIDRCAARACPELEAAYRSGRISHLAARLLLSVAGSRHGGAWIERASVVTLRRLRMEVCWALDARDASEGDSAFEPPPPPPLDHDLAPGPLAVLVEGGLQMRAPGAAADGIEGHPLPHRLYVQLRFHVAPELAALAESTMLAVRRSGESRGSAFERMVTLAVREWLRAPRHRDPVFERDGWRCAVPGCSSRRNLHDHHVLYRSQGGTSARDNRITVCAAHHLHGIHSGRIRARGLAPSAILWDLPIGRFLGDRYLAVG